MAPPTWHSVPESPDDEEWSDPDVEESLDSENDEDEDEEDFDEDEAIGEEFLEDESDWEEDDTVDTVDDDEWDDEPS